MQKKDVTRLKYGLVFGITVILFVLGSLTGIYLAEKKYSNINQLQDEFAVQTAGTELQYMFLLQEPCKFANSEPLASDLDALGKKVEAMEIQRGAKDPDVLHAKNSYSLLEIRNWLLTVQMSEQCNVNFTPLLYFYSNSGDCFRCQEQGEILVALRKKHPELRVYSFDISIGNPAVDTLKARYAITSTPSIVIGDRTLGFSDSNTIEKILNSNTINVR